MNVRIRYLMPNRMIRDLRMSFLTILQAQRTCVKGFFWSARCGCAAQRDRIWGVLQVGRPLLRRGVAACTGDHVPY